MSQKGMAALQLCNPVSSLLVHKSQILYWYCGWEIPKETLLLAQVLPGWLDRDISLTQAFRLTTSEIHSHSFSHHIWKVIAVKVHSGRRKLEYQICFYKKVMKTVGVTNQSALPLCPVRSSKHMEDAEVVKDSQHELQLLQGQIVPDWSSGIGWWSDCIRGQGMRYRCHLPGLLEGL